MQPIDQSLKVTLEKLYNHVARLDLFRTVVQCLGCRDRNTCAEGWDDTLVMAQGEIILSHRCEG